MLHTRTYAAFAATLLSISLAGTLAAQDTSPSTIYIHGNILTGAHLRENDPSPTAAHVSALAVTNSTVVAAGTDIDLLKLRGAHTRVVDLNGAFVLPGFNDAHVHLAEAGLQKLSVNLNGVPSLRQMLDRIGTYTKAARPGQWIEGGGWDQTVWPGGRLPTRQDLDQVTGGHPAFFYRTDGHIVVANSAALLAAGISSATVDPAGSRIDRDQSGTPTGVVREAPAVALIEKKVPPPDTDSRRKALGLALADAAAHGVTSVQDNSSWADWLTLEAMESVGKLPVRVAEWLAFDTPLGVLKERRASHPANDPLLHLTMLKAFMDGSLGSRTAAMAEPYADDQNNYGLPRYQQDQLDTMAAERAAAGFQLGFHAIGDEANNIALDAFAAAEQTGIPSSAAPPPHDADASVVTEASAAYPASEFRFRIEHAQVLLPEDFDRFQKLGVIASMQPSHLLTDMRWAGARLGPEREKYAYAWRSMLDHHVPLAFGTDYPVESINPMRGLYAAITRQNEAGTQTFHPEQRLSIAEAIFAYTQGAAYAESRESMKGRLEPGYLADFVVLDHDLMSASPQEILHTRVLETVIGNQVVFNDGDQLTSPKAETPAADSSGKPGVHQPTAQEPTAKMPATDPS